MITIKRVDAAGAGRSRAAARPGRAEPADLAAAADPAEVYAALVTGVRDYVRKNGFRSVILACPAASTPR